MASQQEDDPAIAHALARMAEGIDGQEEAVRLLDRRFGRMLERYFIRHKVNPDDAEELVWDVWLKMLRSNFRGETRPVVWMWTIARSLLVSHHRKNRPEIRLDDEDWTALLETRAGHSLPEWVRLCIERALHAFETDHPERSEVLRMIAEEWSAAEVGAVFQCAEGAARDRIYRTRERVRQYLEECREEA
jgi:DNA-directed RNA polymerase specialized sigma24 family protein